MLFLSVILFLVTLLLCYAGYVFLVVDRRTEAAVLEDPDLYEALDEKNYIFELPEQVDTYEDLREQGEPTDKRTLPLALLERAKADIPRIEQLEKDHPRMARLFQKGLLPFSVWEQLPDAPSRVKYGDLARLRGLLATYLPPASSNVDDCSAYAPCRLSQANAKDDAASSSSSSTISPSSE